MLRHVSIIRSSSGSCLFLAKITLLKIFTIILARNRQLPDDDRMIETCRSIFKIFNVNNLSMCIGWCADQVTLGSARCKDKDVSHITWPISFSLCNSIRMVAGRCVLTVSLQIPGADNSLARPGKKQARKIVRDARDFNNIETQAVIKFLFLQGKAPTPF